MQTGQQSSEKAYITAGQFFVLLLVSRLSLTLLFSSERSGNGDLWDFFFPILLSVPCLILLLLPLLWYFRQNTGCSVCEYAVRKMGKVGKILPVLYAVYFWITAAGLLLSLREFLLAVLPEGLHEGVILVLLLGGVVYAACKGMEAVSRMSGLVLVMLILAGILLIVFLSPNYSSEKLPPFFRLSYGRISQCLIYFLGRMNVLASLCVLSSSLKGRPASKLIHWSLWLSGILLIVLILFKGCAGEYLQTRAFPVYQVTEISGVLQRWKPFLIFVMVCAVFCCLTLLLLSLSQSVVLSVSRISRKKMTVFAGIALAGVIPLLSLPVVRWFLTDGIMALVSGIIFVTVLPLVVVIHERVTNPHKKRHLSRRVIPAAVSLLIPGLMTLVMLLSLTGCARQLNQSLIVQGMGIDLKDGKYRLTYIVLDTDNLENENASVILRSEGNSTEEALAALQQQRGKQLILNQCLFLMLNEEAAAEVQQTLSVFETTEDFKKTANLMVSSSAADDTITTALQQLGYHAESINVIADSKEIRQPEIHSSFSELMTAHQQQENAFLFPYLVVNRTENALQVDGSFLSDSGNIQILNEEETLAVLAMREQLSDYVDTVQQEGKNVSFRIARVDSALTPVLKEESLTLHFQMRLILPDHPDGNPSLDDLITDKFRHALESCVRKTVQTNGSDIFGVLSSLQGTGPDSDLSPDHFRHLLQSSRIRMTVNCESSAAMSRTVSYRQLSFV